MFWKVSPPRRRPRPRLDLSLRSLPVLSLPPLPVLSLPFLPILSLRFLLILSLPFLLILSLRFLPRPASRYSVVRSFGLLALQNGALKTGPSYDSRT